MAADVQDALRLTEVPLEDQEAKVTLPSSLELMKGDGKVSKFLSRQVCLKSYAYFGHITTDHSYETVIGSEITKQLRPEVSEETAKLSRTLRCNQLFSCNFKCSKKL